MDITVTIPAEEFAAEFHKAIDKAVENLIAKNWQPVIYGKWEINTDGYYPYCSVCGEEPEHGKMSNYCPHCGAMMKGAK